MKKSLILETMKDGGHIEFFMNFKQLYVVDKMGVYNRMTVPQFYALEDNFMHKKTESQTAWFVLKD